MYVALYIADQWCVAFDTWYTRAVCYLCKQDRSTCWSHLKAYLATKMQETLLLPSLLTLLSYAVPHLWGMFRIYHCTSLYPVRKCLSNVWKNWPLKLEIVIANNVYSIVLTNECINTWIYIHIWLCLYIILNCISISFNHILQTTHVFSTNLSKKYTVYINP